MDRAEPASPIERRRRRILDEIGADELQGADSLELVARATTVVCEAERARISIFDGEGSNPLVEIGQKGADREADQQLASRLSSREQVVIIEDLTDAQFQFDDQSDVRRSEDVEFFAGIPLLVENTPIGNLTVLGSEANQLDHLRRAALFGLVNQLESHLGVYHKVDGHREPAARIFDRMTAMVARAMRLRWEDGALSDPVSETLDGLEADIQRVRETVEEMLQPTASPFTGELTPNNPFEAADPTEKADTLGYVETEVEEDEEE
jgi:hypothetical protein